MNRFEQMVAELSTQIERAKAIGLDPAEVLCAAAARACLLAGGIDRLLTRPGS